MTADGTGMYIRHIDRNSIQIQSKDQKQDLNKIQNTQNVQMITVPQGMTVLQNPLNISQMPTVLGQPNSQVYMIPTNQNLVQSGLSQGIIGQQMLPGQNVTVMQPNQLGMPGGVQYNMPLMHAMNMQANSQYMPTGINLNTQLSAQQFNAALSQQLANQNLGTIPIVQAPQASSPLTNTQIPVSQAQVQQILQQNSFITPTSYASMPQQYMMPNNAGAITVPANQSIQYNMPATQSATTSNNGNGQAATENENSNGASNQANYITSSSQDGNGYSMPAANVPNPTQTFTDVSTAQTNFNQQQSQPNSSINATYGNGNGNTPNQGYNNQTTTQPPPSYPTNGSNQAGNSYGSTPPSSSQTTQQSYSPSTTPAPNQTYQAHSLPNMPNVAYPPNQNPYPNATGQNLAAYASNQYQYNSRPWFRPRYGSPQGSPYSSGTGPPSGPPMSVPPPSGNYNYWQDS